MLNVVKAVVSIYRKEEEKPFERFKARVSFGEDHKGIENFKRHLVNFLGLKELSTKFGLGSFELKLYRLVKINGRTENYSINTISCNNNHKTTFSPPKKTTTKKKKAVIIVQIE